MSQFTKTGNKHFIKPGSDISVGSEDVNTFFKQKESPKWLHEDETDTGGSTDLCKSHTYGPVHSTPTDSKKLTSYSIGTTDESLGIVKELEFQPNDSEEVRNTSEGTGNLENSIGNDKIRNVPATSGIIIKDEASKKEGNDDLNSVTAKESPMKESGLCNPVQGLGTGPGPDTLDEMADKQKFFSELEKEMSGTLDYGLLNRQLSKTSTQLATNSVDCNTKDSMKPQVTGQIIKNNAPDTSAKVELLKPPPQQQTSLLSKVLLLDSMGSSLNTTGTSAPAEITSPLATKEGLDKTENPASQKGNQVFQGTITNEEIKELHNALHDINLSSTLPAAEALPSNNLVEESKQPRYLTNDSGQPPNDAHLKNNTKKHIQNATLNIETKENDSFKSVVSEAEKTELNQKKANAKSSSENSVGNIFGFDLCSIVINNEPASTPASSVPASFGPKKVENATSDHSSLHVIDLSKTTNVSKKTNKYSNIQSSGYGWKTASVYQRKPKTPVNSNKSSALIKTSGTSQVASVKSKTESVKNTETSPEQHSKYLNDSKAHQLTVKKSTDADTVDSIHPEVNILKEQLEEERELIHQLKVKIAGNESKYQQSAKQLNQQFQGEIEDLRRANYVLASKVSTATLGNGENGKKLNEQEVHFQKELEENQKLLAAYDTENKRLYNGAKQQKVLQKQTEERMFSENQKLLRELNSLRNQMNLKQISNASAPKLMSLPDDICNKDVIINDSNNNNRNINKDEIINQSIVAEQNQAEINYFKQRCSLLEQTNFELESQISKLGQQKEEMHQVLEEIKKANDDEMKAVESKFFDDIESMKKKLHWYAYNQQLLDQSVSVLQQKDKEIEQLNLRIQKLSSETGKRFEENKLLGKERAANQKRIRNLEHQIKEMEKIYCKRNPNSLPALLMAAGTSIETTSDSHQTPSPLTEMLEQKVQKLENHLQNAQEEGDLRVRTVEQKYNKLKLQYESQIETLEETIKKLQHQAILGRCDICKKASCEKEPEVTETSENVAKDSSETTIKELQQHIDELQSEMEKYQQEDGNLHAQLQKSQNKEIQLQNKVQVLQQQLDSSNNQVATLHCMFSKLQNEKQILMRQQMVKKPTSTNEEWNKKTSKLPQKSKKSDTVAAESIMLGKEEKIISVIEVPEDIMKENESLKLKLEQLQLSLEHQKVDMLKSSAESEADIRKIHEHYQDEIHTLRIAHQKELHQILTEQALKISSSSAVQLQCKVDAQQVLIDHLQEQLANAQVDAEKMSALKVREVVLEACTQQLQDELVEAKSTHSLERQHFQSLVEKIQELERKQDAREKEMLSVMKKGSCLPFSELEREVEKWKKVAESKNADIEKYRVELDSMLSMLTSLKTNGAFTAQNKYMAAMLYR